MTEGRIGHEYLWRFSGKKFLQVVRQASSILGLEKFQLEPYQNRGVGATHDRLMNLRDEESTRKRRRWSGQEMVSRYSKPGRVQQYLRSFESWATKFGRLFLSDASNYVRGSLELHLPCAVDEVVEAKRGRKRGKSPMSSQASKLSARKLPACAHKTPAPKLPVARKHPAMKRRR